MLQHKGYCAAVRKQQLECCCMTAATGKLLHLHKHNSRNGKAAGIAPSKPLHWKPGGGWLQRATAHILQRPSKCSPAARQRQLKSCCTAAAVGGLLVQHPQSPSIGNKARVGCNELSPTCCSPSRTWVGATDSAPVGGGHTSRAPPPGPRVQPGSAVRPRNAEGATGGSFEGPRSASYGMAG